MQHLEQTVVEPEQLEVLEQIKRNVLLRIADLEAADLRAVPGVAENAPEYTAPVLLLIRSQSIRADRCAKSHCRGSGSPRQNRSES
jgi:hypothetical protein